MRRPDGEIVLDPTGRLPGRGAYLCADRPACLELAIAKGALGRALKTTIPTDLRDALASVAVTNEDQTELTDMTIEGGARGQE